MADEHIKEMRERHEREIAFLRSSCPHEKISDWMMYEWAPGHMAGRVRVCEHCGKIIEEEGTGMQYI